MEHRADEDMDGRTDEDGDGDSGEEPQSGADEAAEDEETQQLQHQTPKLVPTRNRKDDEARFSATFAAGAQVQDHEVDIGDLETVIPTQRKVSELQVRVPPGARGICSLTRGCLGPVPAISQFGHAAAKNLTKAHALR